MLYYSDNKQEIYFENGQFHMRFLRHYSSSEQAFIPVIVRDWSSAMLACYRTPAFAMNDETGLTHYINDIKDVICGNIYMSSKGLQTEQEQQLWNFTISDNEFGFYTQNMYYTKTADNKIYANYSNTSSVIQPILFYFNGDWYISNTHESFNEKIYKKILRIDNTVNEFSNIVSLL